jgi:two-component system sensor histidine kinase ResE
MRSVFYWRILIVSIIALLLANVILLAAYTFVGKNTYVAIEMANLEPEAEVTRQIYEEYKNGFMSENAFQRLIEKQTLSSESAILISDALGKILIVRNIGSTVEMQDFGEYYRAEMQNVLRGQTVENKDLQLLNGETAVSVGIPVRDTDGNVTGGILVIKQIQRIQSAFNKLNNVLTGTIFAIMPVVILLVAFSTNRLNKPLHDMSNAAIEMSKGRFNVRANERATGEIGILARALNTLCDNLAQTIYQLQSEKRQLNQLLSSFTDGVAAIDNIGCLTHYNPALMKMFGAVDVKVPMDLVPDESIWELFRSAYDTHEPVSMHYTLPNDRALWITIVPVTDEIGECTGVVGLFKDVTDLERLEKTRRDYVANVSHELRTPLTAVRGLLEPLSDGMITDEETKQRYYRIMLREVIRLSRLITDMLELSRLQSGTEHMELHAVDLVELLQDTRQNYVNEAAQRGISLNLQLEQIPYAMTDEDRVEQLLVILIDNAMRYTPEGGSITISASQTKGERILVTVSDTGCGIAPDDLPHIFERFFKTDRSRKEGGTGLGLSIAKQIIDKLGENIYVESRPNEGTSFHFTLKNYISNAIALGPVGAGFVIHEDMSEGFRAAERSSQDAPYEVLPKRQSDKKSGKGEEKDKHSHSKKTKRR